MLRPIADTPCSRASPPRRLRRCGRYLLRRGCAMKSRDTASTCSLLAWWLLMVLEYISGCVPRSTSHTRAYPSLFTLTNSRRYCRCVDRERDGLMRRRGGRERGWTKYTEIVREELGSGFSGSCALIRIAFLGTSRERQCGYIGERKNSCSGGGRDERGTEDQARAITWLGLGESLNVPFEPSSMKKLVFGAKERHAKSKEISI